MTRIDMTTREWHELITPVLPHASTDADDRELSAVRIEAAQYAIYAVAFDRYTLAAQRHALKPGLRLWDTPGPVHVRATDAAASLRLFTFSKDADPPLRITIDVAPIPVTVVGRETTVDRLATPPEADARTPPALHPPPAWSCTPTVTRRATRSAPGAKHSPPSWAGPWPPPRQRCT